MNPRLLVHPVDLPQNQVKTTAKIAAAAPKKSKSCVWNVAVGLAIDPKEGRVLMKPMKGYTIAAMKGYF